jgi:hypothetical protein
MDFVFAFQQRSGRGGGPQRQPRGCGAQAGGIGIWFTASAAARIFLDASGRGG